MNIESTAELIVGEGADHPGTGDDYVGLQLIELGRRSPTRVSGIESLAPDERAAHLGGTFFEVLLTQPWDPGSA